MNKIASVLGMAIFAGALTSCSALTSNTYCLEEQEKGNYDYMVVTDSINCEQNTDDVEWYSTGEYLDHGHVAYVELDGSHSKATVKKREQVKTVTNVPPYTPPATPRFTPPPAPVVPKNNVPANNAPKVNVPAPANNNQNKANTGNSSGGSKGSSNAGSVSGGRK